MSEEQKSDQSERVAHFDVTNKHADYANALLQRANGANLKTPPQTTLSPSSSAKDAFFELILNGYVNLDRDSTKPVDPKQLYLTVRQQMDKEFGANDLDAAFAVEKQLTDVINSKDAAYVQLHKDLQARVDEKQARITELEHMPTRALFKGPYGLIVNKLQHYGIKVDIPEDATPAQVSQAIRYGITMLHDRSQAKLVAAQKKNSRLNDRIENADKDWNENTDKNLALFRLMRDHGIVYDADVPVESQLDALAKAIEAPLELRLSHALRVARDYAKKYDSFEQCIKIIAKEDYGFTWDPSRDLGPQSVELRAKIQDIINEGKEESTKQDEYIDSIHRSATVLARKLGQNHIKTPKQFANFMGYLSALLLKKEEPKTEQTETTKTLFDDNLNDLLEGEPAPDFSKPEEAPEKPAFAPETPNKDETSKYKAKDLEALANETLKDELRELLEPYHSNERRRKLIGMSNHIDDYTLEEMVGYLKTIIIKHQEGQEMLRQEAESRAQKLGIKSEKIDSYSGVKALNVQISEEEAKQREEQEKKIKHCIQRLQDDAGEYGLSRNSVDELDEVPAFVIKIGDKIREISKSSLMIGKETDEARQKVEADCRTPYGAAMAMAAENVQLKADPGRNSIPTLNDIKTIPFEPKPLTWAQLVAAWHNRRIFKNFS